MACGSIYDAFKQRAEFLGPELYRRATFLNPYINVVPRGTYTKGAGLVKSVFEIGNSYPTTDERTWDAYTLATGSNAGACAYNFTDVTTGFDEITYSPSHFQLRGPLWCKDELYFSFNADQTLGAYVDELSKLAEYEIGNKIYQDYAGFVPKMVTTASGPITDAGAPFTALPEATSQLTQEYLDKVAVHLIHKRATNPDSNGFVVLANGGPVFTISLGLEASQALATNNAALRQDIRDSTPGLLMKRMGANVAWKGWRHMINPLPPRYSFSGGTYTRVDTFIDVTGTKGTYQDINPSYLDVSSAPFEAAVVLNPAVMVWDWVEPEASVGGVKWDPQSYMGNWQFITGAEACAADGTGYDPFKKYGRHIAEIAAASKPGPNRSAGLVILFKRCALTTLTGVTCT